MLKRHTLTRLVIIFPHYYYYIFFYLIFIKCKLTLTRIHCFLRINKPPKTKIKKKLIKICLVYLLLNSNLYILANILLKYFSIF